MHIQLLEESRIDIAGEDALEWLNGQLTCDLREETPGSATYGLILSPKGKLISDVWVLHRASEGDEQRFSLSLPKLYAQEAFDRLERFLVMEDVELEWSEERVLSVQGEGAENALPKAGHVWPVARIHTEGAEVWLPEDEATTLASTLGLTEHQAYQDARIEAGIPALGTEMGAGTLPQEVGLRGAVSFNKGCYVGQEPVVMLEHRGKPPKRLVQVEVTGASAGDELASAGKSVGRVTSVHSTLPLALALVKRKHLEDVLHLGERKVTSLRVVEDGAPRRRT